MSIFKLTLRSLILLSLSVSAFSYSETTTKAVQPKQAITSAIFAGGCFWCVESLFQELDGVVHAESGFSGGSLRRPTYKGNHKGHHEVVLVKYLPDVISYQQLLDIFLVNIDPFDARGQFCDKGPSYRSAIFVENQQERDLAQAKLDEVQQRFNSNTVVTEILDRKKFWPVERAHQDYYKKNPIRYGFYRRGCGRDKRLESIWGDDFLKTKH